MGKELLQEKSRVPSRVKTSFIHCSSRKLKLGKKTETKNLHRDFLHLQVVGKAVFPSHVIGLQL